MPVTTMSETSKIPQKGRFRRTQGLQFGTGSASNSRKQTGNQKLNKSTQKGDEDHEEDDSDLCVICAEKLKYIALSPCSHKTCHKCAFRQRSLYEKKTCLICRTENETLTFTERIHAEYDDTKDFTDHNEKYGINFTSIKSSFIKGGINVKYTFPAIITNFWKLMRKCRMIQEYL